MTGGLGAAPIAILAVAVIGGATVAISTREARLAILGLLTALLASPFVADPLPDPRGIVARIAGAALAGYLLIMAVRSGEGRTAGSQPGWPADALIALTAGLAAASAAAGWETVGDLGHAVSEESGPIVPAAAAGAVLLVLAVGPVLVARDHLRLTVGLCLGVLGAMLLQAGLGGPPTAFGNLLVALLLVVVAGAGAALVRAGRRAALPSEPRKP